MIDIVSKQQEIRTRAEHIRRAVNQINKVKKLVQSFDGKVYNCKFDEAVRDLSTDQDRLYVSNQYGWFYIQYQPRNFYNHGVSLLTGYSCKAEDKKTALDNSDYILFDGKRIKAAAMIEGLNKSREKLLQEAFELENAANNLEDTVNKIEALKKAINTITGALPYTVVDICKFTRHYY